MSTTTERAERVAGRKAATELADELTQMSQEYMRAFCQELLKRMPKDVSGK